MLFILDIKTVMYDEFFYDYMKPEYYNKWQVSYQNNDITHEKNV